MCAFGIVTDMGSVTCRPTGDRHPTDSCISGPDFTLLLLIPPPFTPHQTPTPPEPTSSPKENVSAQFTIPKKLHSPCNNDHQTTQSKHKYLNQNIIQNLAKGRIFKAIQEAHACKLKIDSHYPNLVETNTQVQN